MQKKLKKIKVSIQAKIENLAWNVNRNRSQKLIKQCNKQFPGNVEDQKHKKLNGFIQFINIACA